MLDLLLGRLDADQRQSFQERLKKENDLQNLKADVENAFKALDALPDVQPPEDLVEKTLARIRHDQQIKALLAKQENTRRVFRPTFSLRELGAIAAAAVIMAAVFIPSIRQARNTSMATACASKVGQIGSAMLSFANANNNLLPIADVQNNRWLANQSAPSQPTVSNSAALFRLVQQSYAQPPLFQCPAVGCESFEARSGMVDFPAAKYVHYSFQHNLGGAALSRNNPQLAGRESQMAILADCTPVFDGGHFLREYANDNAASPNHKGAGQNVLYLDGHVAWADKPTVGIDGDNIYLMKKVTEYRGDEAPVDPTDSFLLPAYSNR